MISEVFFEEIPFTDECIKFNAYWGRKSFLMMDFILRSDLNLLIVFLLLQIGFLLVSVFKFGVCFALYH